MAELEDMDDDFGLKQPVEPEPKKKPGPPKKPSATAAVVEPEPEPEASTPAELKQPAQIAQVAPPPVKPRVGIVQRDISILWSKRVIKVRAGTEVSDDAYGPNAFERFEAQGVAMLEKL